MSDEIQQFDYDDDKPQEFLICYKGLRYILTEANENAAIRFRNVNLKASHMVIKDGEPVSAKLEGGAESQIALLSGCICKAVPDPSAPPHLIDKNGKGWKVDRDRSGRPVYIDQKQLAEWGSKVIKPLFEKAKEISDLAEKEAPKNGKPNTLTNHDDTISGEEGRGSVSPNGDGDKPWEPPDMDDPSPKGRDRTTTSSS
jgi:hypothetical protein